MCSYRTYVPMIAAVVIPAFDLRATLRSRPGLAIEPAALAPLPGKEPLLGSVTAAAEAKGVRPGMRLGEALATCPELVLVEQDPAAVEQAWEQVLRRLEDAGFAVEPAEPGTVYFETARRRAALRRPRAGAQAGARGGRAGVGAARRGCRAAVRRARRGERRAAGAGADRLRRPHAAASSRRCR